MKTIKKAEAGSSFAKLAPPYDKATFADKIAGAKKSAGKAKSGASVKKAKNGTIVPKKNSVSKNVGNLNKAKSGTSMKKCKYGCK